jgi:signal transduction histidine kinase
VFKVEDNGPGIPKEQQGNLFEAFYRAQNDHNKGIDGTGLGLSLVKGVVERSGGKLIFESVEHEGSTFGFELPLFPGT